MKLILSSCDFSHEKSRDTIIGNLCKPLSLCKVLFFPNEKSLEMSIRKSKYVKRLENYGFSRENIIVFDYSNPENFKGLEIDVVYISGGNTFGTLMRIRNAGFEEDIVDYVKKGAIYIGGSAGAHIASADIRHIEKYDDNRFGITDYKGLGLYDGILICHFTEQRREHFESLKSEGKYEVKSLTDEESLIIQK